MAGDEPISEDVFSTPFGTKVQSSEEVFGATVNYRLLESGDRRLLEDGNFRLIE